MGCKWTGQTHHKVGTILELAVLVKKLLVLHDLSFVSFILIEVVLEGSLTLVLLLLVPLSLRLELVAENGDLEILELLLDLLQRRVVGAKKSSGQSDLQVDDR